MFRYAYRVRGRVGVKAEPMRRAQTVGLGSGFHHSHEGGRQWQSVMGLTRKPCIVYQSSQSRCVNQKR